MNPQSESHEKSSKAKGGSKRGNRSGATEDKPAEADGAEASVVQVAARSKGSRHLYWIAGVMAAVVVLFSTGAAMAYTFWYQQPEKVVSDTFFNLLTAHTTSFNGTVDSTNKTAKVKMDFDGAVADNLITAHSKSQVTSGALSATVNSTVQTGPNNEVYIKVANARELATLFTQLMGGQSSGTLSELVSTLNDKWVKVTPQEVGDSDVMMSAKGMQCAARAVNSFQGEATARREVTDLYSQHRFIVIQESLGERGGNLGYKLGVDQAQAEAFMAGLKDTQVYGIVRSCDSNFALDEDMLTGNNGITEFEIWSSKLNHELVAAKITSNGPSGSSTNTVTIKPTFNAPVTITTPKDIVTLDELRQDIQGLVAPLSSTRVSTAQ